MYVQCRALVKVQSTNVQYQLRVLVQYSMMDTFLSL